VCVCVCVQVLLFRLISESKVLQFPATANLSPDCKDLLRRLLKKNPLERLSLEAFFMHPFLDFSNYKRENPYDIDAVLQNTTINANANDSLTNSTGTISNVSLVFLGPIGVTEPISSDTPEDLGVNALNAAMNSTLALPIARGSSNNQLLRQQQEDNAAAAAVAAAALSSSPSDALLLAHPVAMVRDKSADEDFVMIEPEMVVNHATVDGKNKNKEKYCISNAFFFSPSVLLNAPVLPGSLPSAAGLSIPRSLQTGSPTRNAPRCLNLGSC